MNARVVRAGLGNHVKLVGFIGEEELPEYYRAADLFVVPSAALEGFGLVTPGALASGTPVVGTPVGGTPEILGRLDPRLLTSDPTPAAITEKLAEVVKNPSWLPSAEQCRRFTELHYGWASVAAAVEGLFEEVVGAARRPLRGHPLRVAYFNGNPEISGAEINLLQTVETITHHSVEPLLVIPDAGELAERVRALGTALPALHLRLSQRPASAAALVTGLAALVSSPTPTR